MTSQIKVSQSEMSITDHLGMIESWITRDAPYWMKEKAIVVHVNFIREALAAPATTEAAARCAAGKIVEYHNRQLNFRKYDNSDHIFSDKSNIAAIITSELASEAALTVEDALVELKTLTPHGPPEILFSSTGWVRIEVWPSQLATLQKRFIRPALAECLQAVRDFKEKENNG